MVFVQADVDAAWWRRRHHHELLLPSWCTPHHKNNIYLPFLFSINLTTNNWSNKIITTSFQKKKNPLEACSSFSYPYTTATTNTTTSCLRKQL